MSVCAVCARSRSAESAESAVRGAFVRGRRMTCDSSCDGVRVSFDDVRRAGVSVPSWSVCSSCSSDVSMCCSASALRRCLFSCAEIRISCTDRRRAAKARCAALATRARRADDAGRRVHSRRTSRRPQRWRRARGAPTGARTSRRTSRGPSGAMLADLDFALMAQWQSICLVNKRSVVRSRVRAVRGFFLFFFWFVLSCFAFFKAGEGGAALFLARGRDPRAFSAANAPRNAAHREISPPAPTSPLPAPRPPRPPPCPAGSPP